MAENGLILIIILLCHVITEKLQFGSLKCGIHIEGKLVGTLGMERYCNSMGQVCINGIRNRSIIWIQQVEETVIRLNISNRFRIGIRAGRFCYLQHLYGQRQCQSESIRTSRSFKGNQVKKSLYEDCSLRMHDAGAKRYRKDKDQLWFC